MLKNHLHMNPKTIIDNWIAFISGTGGGIITLQVQWHDEWVKLMTAAITAGVMGAAGVAGKYVMVWGWKRFKTLLKK
jgi:hypothetical protein